jgi:sugar/nucleoside kinase (ribokinase family)
MKAASSTTQTIPHVEVLVAGALASDTICDYKPLAAGNGPAPVLQTSNPSNIGQSAGGVGRNVAVAAKYAGARVALATVVADDLAGKSLTQQMTDAGFPADFITTLKTADGARTAQYVAVNDAKKDLVLAMADMNILRSPKLEQQQLWDEMLRKSRPKWMVVDGNWSAAIMSAICTSARRNSVPIAFEPVSTAKSITPFDKHSPSVKLDDCVPSQTFSLATPNQFELAAMHKAAQQGGYFDSQEWWSVVDSFGLSSAGTREKFISVSSRDLVEQGIPQQCMQLLPYIPNIVTKMGSQGCLLAQIIPEDDPRLRDPEAAPYMISRCMDSRTKEIGGIYMRLFPAAEQVPEHEVISVNGIGDTMLGTIVAGLAKGHTLEAVIPLAQEASVLSLKSAEAVSPAVQAIANRLKLLAKAGGS